MSALTAGLLGDRGEAAVDSGNFFRSRAFLDAEGVTHTLRIETAEGAVLLAPLIVREIPGAPEYRDAISPYGYPGLVPPPTDRGRSSDRIAGKSATAGVEPPPAPLEPGAIDFSATGLVSAFLRHALGEPPLAGTTERNLVQIADPALPPKSRPSDRRQVRRNLEDGYTLELTAGEETTPAQRAALVDLYEQTMRRTAAAEHYFFGAAYFDRVLEAPGTRLVTVRGPQGDPAAVSLATVSDGFLHYYLSGSADSHLRASPMKNVVARLVELATELDLPLNLGGGIAPGDALEEFKRGFANRTDRFRTSELICAPDIYQHLSAGKSASGFFPAYRSNS